MLVKGVFTSHSGSLGGITGSHNAGGLYLRARRIPVNPNTALQQEVRSALRDLVQRWAESVSETNRGGWRVYAENVPLPGPLGDPRVVSGQNHYIRSNTPRLQAQMARVDSAPGVFDTGGFTDPVYTVAAGDEVDVAFSNADDWANETGSALLIYVGNPVNQSTTFYGGPFRFLGRILGNGTLAPTSPATFIAPFAFISGQKVGLYARVTRVDGRLSGRSSSIVDVT